MNETVLRIMMHGLIALAPSANVNDPNHITALLLDARMPHGTECVTAHRPELSFLLAEGQPGKCDDAGCELIGERHCKCADSLSRKQIWLQILPASLPDPPAAALAETEDGEDRANDYGLPSLQAPMGSGKLFYVANLAKAPFNARLNPDYLAPQPNSQNLLARMDVPFEKLIECSLSKREDQGDTYILPMGFRAIGRRSRADEPDQALAQMVVAERKVPAGSTVRLHIADFDGSNQKTLVLATATHGEHNPVYMIRLSNEPKVLERGDPCDDGIARHFAHYYEFAENPPAWSDRLIPHVRFTTGLRVSGSQPDPNSVEPEACEHPTFTLMDRPICPMGSFLLQTPGGLL